jgi:anti-sigma-K factor RskA
VPAGTFTPSGPASVVTLPPAAASADTIAVTVEPAGGSDQPTSDPIMAVSLT